jgi:predicted ArsR family transcriptional regulator
VLLALADYANDDGLAWPSVLSLALKTILTERQVRNILGQLEAAGELEVIRRGGRGRTNLYRLTISQRKNTEKITLKSTQRNPEIPGH